MSKPLGLATPLRRVVAVDAGNRCIRLVWLESRFGRIRVLGQEAVDLQAEGLVATEEIQSHVQNWLSRWGRPPLALVLPQNAAVSQLVDLPSVPESEARQLIEAETVKFSGGGESVLVYDFARLPTRAENRHDFWVSFCHESEIESHLARLGIEREDFCEITTTANALFSAWRFAGTDTADAVLVHLGAQNTTLVVVQQGVAVFASNFSMGSDFFTRAIARLKAIPPEAAEVFKHGDDLLSGTEELAGYAEAVDGWAVELQRQLSEWCGPQLERQTKLAGFRFVASGAGFAQPGLLQYLARRKDMKLEAWPVVEGGPSGAGFEVALGAGLQALGYNPQPASLLPASRRSAWNKRLARRRLTYANALLLGVGFLVLAFGIWSKLDLIQQKRALADKVQAGLDAVRDHSALRTALLADYESMRPLFERQQNTQDIMRSLALLQHVRQDRNLWFVLLADQVSYFSYSLPTAVTNRNGLTALMEADGAIRRREATNVSPARAGLIAELCVLDEADGGRRMLSTVVSELKASPVFARVDLLPEDLRRPLADPRVIVTNRHFALALDFAVTEFQSSPRMARPPIPARHSHAAGVPAKSGAAGENSISSAP